jgi:hypothetical protein
MTLRYTEEIRRTTEKNKLSEPQFLLSDSQSNMKKLLLLSLFID